LTVDGTRIVRTFLSDSARARAARLLDVSLLLCGLCTLVLFGLVLGFPLQPATRDLVANLTHFVLLLFAAQEAARFALAPRRLAHLRSRKIEALLAAVVLLEVALGGRFVAWLDSLDTGLSPATLTLLYLGGAQLTVLVSLGLRALRDSRWSGGRTLTPGLVLLLSFSALIAVGTLLFKTPHATTDAGISWVDALFVATSAVCVTGLSPVDVSTTFTIHGQWVLLGLIQLGGLGVMTLTYFFAYFMAGGVSLRSRIDLSDLLSEENIGQIGGVLAVIVAFTFGVEAVGAVAIYTSLSGVPGAPDNLAFFALFHSVSAFCNAGFSTLSAGLSEPVLAANHGLILSIIPVIILGGLGYPVVKNFWDFTFASARRRLGLRLATPPRLTANSRVVLVTTGGLLVVGTVVYWLTEYALAAQPGAAAAGSPWLTALFYASSARTAGFNVTPMDALLPATAAWLMFLMFVGGGPASTAGGIKTSTLAVALLSLRRVLFGRRDIEAFGRRLPDELANRALSIILVAVAFTTAVSLALLVLHPEMEPAALVFEAVSAVATTGLSRGVTAELSDPAKLVLSFAMLVGRVGVLGFLLAFIPRREPTGLRLPETTIVLS
jgi:Trk-type K+ transport system membrane component